MIALQLLFNGLIAGSIYALIASGFSLIYSATRFVHFAHGSVAAIGGYILFFTFAAFGLPFWLCIILALVGTSVFGVLCFGILYRPLMKRGSSNAILLIASLGLMILIDNVLLMVFGADVKSIGAIQTQKGIDIFGAIVTPLQIIIFVTSVVLLVSLYVFVKKTTFGKKMRAVADNPFLADITGINATKVQYVGFAIGSALAGVAGILIGLEQNVEPLMGTPLMIKGFAGAIIGGVTSIPGSVLGSYLLGLVENFGVWYLPSGYKDAIAFTLLLLFLLVRPDGILGIKKGVRQ